jgi:hypothetical protein
MMQACSMDGLQASHAPSGAGDTDCGPCYSRDVSNWYGDDGRG